MVVAPSASIMIWNILLIIRVEFLEMNYMHCILLTTRVNCLFYCHTLTVHNIKITLFIENCRASEFKVLNVFLLSNLDRV